MQAIDRHVSEKAMLGGDLSFGMTPEHLAFCRARRDMNRRLLAWLRAGGDLAMVREETATATALMQQLTELGRAHASG